MIRYNSYSSYIKELFSERVQKLSVNAGLTCPNRDGTKGRGGCVYCDNNTFNPEYCKPEKSISEQLKQGISFFSKKYDTMRYLAYFQSYTNTYAKSEKLFKLYQEALSYPGIIGIVIATRPDCINDEILNRIQQMSEKHYVAIEYGIESTLDTTLEFVNRQHTYQESCDAIIKTANKAINTGAHMILGLPGEGREVILSHAKRLSALPLNTLKLHQLQIIRGTRMAEIYKNSPELFTNFSVDEYIELCLDFIEYLDPGIIIERFISQSPPEMLISPRWGLKNFEFVARLEKALESRNTWQGKRL